MFLSTWRKLVQQIRRKAGLSWRAGSVSDRSRRKPLQLMLELLEDRMVPAASTFQWTAAGAGNWSTPGNWTKTVDSGFGNTVPGIGDIAQFNATYAAAFTVTVDVASAAGEVDFGST